jgi:hypothetical protein
MAEEIIFCPFADDGKIVTQESETPPDSEIKTSTEETKSGS